MDKYDLKGIVGEGAYGIVYKAVNKDTGEFVAIKKFKESEEDDTVKKTTIREIKILATLKHENIIQLIKKFRKGGRYYLVFEYVEKNLLEILEEKPHGLDATTVQKYIYQLLKAIDFCHKHQVIHRDIKPENLLIIPESNMLKLCDFGFARSMPSKEGIGMTDYVATRWYRAPELLLGAAEYGKEVDIWAIGCIMGELIDGQPLFPGESEIDQLYLIQKIMGQLTQEQKEAFAKNPHFIGLKFPDVSKPETLEKRYLGKLSKKALSFMKGVLKMDPNERFTAEEALAHTYFDDIREDADVEPPKPLATSHSKSKQGFRNASQGPHISSQTNSINQLTVPKTGKNSSIGYQAPQNNLQMTEMRNKPLTSNSKTSQEQFGTLNIVNAKSHQKVGNAMGVVKDNLQMMSNQKNKNNKPSNANLMNNSNNGSFVNENQASFNFSAVNNNFASALYKPSNEYSYNINYDKSSVHASTNLIGVPHNERNIILEDNEESNEEVQEYQYLPHPIKTPHGVKEKIVLESKQKMKEEVKSSLNMMYKKKKKSVVGDAQQIEYNLRSGDTGGDYPDDVVYLQHSQSPRQTKMELAHSIKGNKKKQQALQLNPDLNIVRQNSKNMISKPFITKFAYQQNFDNEYNYNIPVPGSKNLEQLYDYGGMFNNNPGSVKQGGGMHGIYKETDMQQPTQRPSMQNKNGGSAMNYRNEEQHYAYMENDHLVMGGGVPSGGGGGYKRKY